MWIQGSLHTLVGNWTNSGSMGWGVAWVWSAEFRGSLSTLVGNWNKRGSVGWGRGLGVVSGGLGVIEHFSG